MNNTNKIKTVSFSAEEHNSIFNQLVQSLPKNKKMNRINKIAQSIYTHAFEIAKSAQDKKMKPSNGQQKTAQVKKPQFVNQTQTASFLRNAEKAVTEHRARATDAEKQAYATFEEITSSAKTVKNAPLSFKHQVHEAQGPRSSMEDAHFYHEFDQGILAGIFDGHGGSEVSKYASEQFKKRFPAMLKAKKGDVRQTFETLIQEITNEVFKKPEWNNQGTTAVITFVDKKTNIAYTATIGDSEANIYRKINGKIKSIAASCVRDWSSDKDWQRHQKVNTKITKPDNPKHIRSTMINSFIGYGVNISRAIGDKYQTGTKDKPLVTNKPKITAVQLKKGDLLVLACDGLKDYVPEDKIVDIISKNARSSNLAETLVIYSLNEGKSRDNVTVRVITT